MPITTTQPAPWPAGVTARYLTHLDAHVDVYGTDTATAQCSASCDWTTGTISSATAHTRAQAHAATCRAMPRPETATGGAQ